MLVDMQQSRVSGLEGGSYCMWHVSVSFRRSLICPSGGAPMSQRMDERVGVLLCICVGERSELELSVRGFPLCIFFIANTYESTAGCVFIEL